MSDWQPDRYLQFHSERTQPSIDLVAKIDKVAPEYIIDIGCGPGNSTQVLSHRWPQSKIIGIDTSASMIARAGLDFPKQEWQTANASTYEPTTKFDIVFSNAVIQWIPDHEKLFAKFHSLLCGGGIVAVQIPLFWDMPLGVIIDEVAQDIRWKNRTEKVERIFTIHDHVFYYDLLSSLFTSIELWETDYLHILESHESIIEMMRSTGLKPYHELLSDEERGEFEKAVLKGIQQAYPTQKNGKVLLPFKRLFLKGIK